MVIFTNINKVPIVNDSTIIFKNCDFADLSNIQNTCKNLTLISCSRITIYNLQQLPNSIEKMHIECCDKLCDWSFKSLPSSITSLSLILNAGTHFKILGFPPNLKELFIAIINDNEDDALEFINFPHGLQRFRLWFSARNANNILRELPNEVSYVELKSCKVNEALYLLPAKLQSLCIYSCDIRDKYLERLPDLKTLNLYDEVYITKNIFKNISPLTTITHNNCLNLM